MVDKKRGLGKGLSELLGGQSIQFEEIGGTPSYGLQGTAVAAVQDNKDPYHQPTLPISKLHPCPHQPRVEIEPESLEELAQSVREKGVLQPLIVRPMGDHYEIVAGERRWRAAQIAGLTEVPVVVKALSDEQAMAIALIENIQREDLNPMEIAVALDQLLQEFSSITHENLAQLVGKSRSAVSNFLRLLTLEDPVKQMLRNGDLEMGHARALLAFKGSLQVQMAKTIIDKSLSVRSAENLVRQHQNKPASGSAQPSSHKIVLDESLARYQKRLSDQLDTKVKIKPLDHKGERGELIIQYKDRKKLKQMLDLLL